MKGETRVKTTLKTQPKQSMREFFAREDVIDLQNIQKMNRPDSLEHRNATAEMEGLAAEVGAGEYFD